MPPRRVQTAPGNRVRRHGRRPGSADGRQNGHTTPRRPCRPRAAPAVSLDCVRSLRARLVVSAALVIAAVVGLSTYLQSRIVARRGRGRGGRCGRRCRPRALRRPRRAHRAAHRRPSWSSLLADYRKAVPAVQSITITAGAPGPTIAVASTDAPPPPRALRLGEQAIAQRGLVTYADGPVGLHFVAVSLERQHRPFGAVIVAVRMDALQRVQRQSRQAALVFASAAILLLAARHRRGRAPAGAPPAARDPRHDGARIRRATSPPARPAGARTRSASVAEGLNAMLERTAGFNDTLRAEVERATAELREANAPVARDRAAAVRRAARAGEQPAAGARRRDGRLRRAPDRHAAQRDVGLRADAARGAAGGLARRPSACARCRSRSRG